MKKLPNALHSRLIAINIESNGTKEKLMAQQSERFQVALVHACILTGLFTCAWALTVLATIQ